LRILPGIRTFSFLSTGHRSSFKIDMTEYSYTYHYSCSFQLSPIRLMFKLRVGTAILIIEETTFCFILEALPGNIHFYAYFQRRNGQILGAPVITNNFPGTNLQYIPAINFFKPRRTHAEMLFCCSIVGFPAGFSGQPMVRKDCALVVNLVWNNA